MESQHEPKFVTITPEQERATDLKSPVDISPTGLDIIRTDLREKRDRSQALLESGELDPVLRGVVINDMARLLQAALFLTDLVLRHTRVENTLPEDWT